MQHTMNCRPHGLCCGASPAPLTRVVGHTRARKTQVIRAQQSQTEKETVKEIVKAPSSAPQPKPPPLREPQTPRPVRAIWKVALDQVLDSAIDVGRHIGRQVAPLPLRDFNDEVSEGTIGSKLRLAKLAKPRVVVLGSGWGAHSLIKVIDTDAFDIILVSPRNHFVFTPMLPSTAVGTVEFRSLLEPIRQANPFVQYLQATCDSIDAERKTISCTAASQTQEGLFPQFEVPYDVLVMAVGEKPATFGVKGVQEHCFFMKEVTDTVNLRKRIGQCFELAALPGTSKAERNQLLSFVVVGGGPTGVEFAGTLSDFLRIDLKQKFPELIKYVSVTLVQSAQAILPQFDSRLATRAMETLTMEGVNVRTGLRVVEVKQDEVVLKGGDVIKYGVCVWSTGNSTNPLVQALVSSFPEQDEWNAGKPSTTQKLYVDPYLRVIGARDVIALGDCCTVSGLPLPATAQVAGQQGSYIAHLLNKGCDVGLGGDSEPSPSHPLVKGPFGLPLPLLLQGADAGSLASMDGGGRAYFNKPFEFLSLGIMAYVGADQAVTQIDPVNLKVSGGLAFLLWRSVYITKQVSLRNRILILFDWLKTRLFGRDTSLF